MPAQTRPFHVLAVDAVVDIVTSARRQGLSVLGVAYFTQVLPSELVSANEISVDSGENPLELAA